tara:strand:+ start:162 stop:473 length:312 start_codon:yes stop_codon:yes gene_type:complete
MPETPEQIQARYLVQQRRRMVQVLNADPGHDTLAIRHRNLSILAGIIRDEVDRTHDLMDLDDASKNERIDTLSSVVNSLCVNFHSFNLAFNASSFRTACGFDE